MDRLEFLARLAAGLQPGGGTATPADPGAVRQSESPIASPGDLAERFVARASAAGAVVAGVATRTEADSAAERLASERGWRSAVGPHGMSLCGVHDGDPADADFGLEVADWAVADTGSVLTLSGPGADRRRSILPPASGLFVHEDRILATLGDALRQLERENRDLPSCCTFITGPSSTADIAGHHVVGAHGPVEVFIWVIAESAEASASPNDRPGRKPE
jgi:hypothetical protein